jgi:hypothetical protein
LVTRIRVASLMPSPEHWRLFQALGDDAAYLDIETSDDVVGFAGISAIGVSLTTSRRTGAIASFSFGLPLQMAPDAWPIARFQTGFPRFSAILIASEQTFVATVLAPTALWWISGVNTPAPSAVKTALKCGVITAPAILLALSFCASVRRCISITRPICVRALPSPAFLSMVLKATPYSALRWE